MILTDNIIYIKNHFPDTWSKLKEFETKNNVGQFDVVTSRKGIPTLVMNTETGQKFIHSKYDPVKEAEQIISQFDGLDQYKHVVFYGVGLGYHIDELIKKHPYVTFSIIEPNVEILYQYLSVKKLSELPSNRLKFIFVADTENGVKISIQKLVKEGLIDTYFIPLPSYQRLFADSYTHFEDLIKNEIKGKRTEIRTTFAFEKRWIINSIKNFIDVVTTPNVLHLDRSLFENKPFLLLAAGPSLQEEIENIRYIKENGLAYIFSVGSAINALLANGILPDAASTYDPSELNQKVFQQIVEQGITEVPLIFGSSVGFETLENYPGPKLHMLINQDTISAHYLRRIDGEPVNFLHDAPSIAVVTLQLLHQLGANPIILVGQNLAFRNRMRYSQGIEYDHVSSAVSDMEHETSIIVKDVEGRDIYTSEGYNRMRLQLESVIKRNHIANVINTTKDGAHIEGTRYMPLDKVIDRMLTEKVVVHDWLNAKYEKYDCDFIKEQSIEIDNELINLKDIFSEFRDLLADMQQCVLRKRITKLQKLFTEFDNLFTKLQTNKFYVLIINRMSRSHFDLVMKMLGEASLERNEFEKAQRVIREFGAFLDNCYVNMLIVEPILEKMHTALRSLDEDEK